MSFAADNQAPLREEVKQVDQSQYVTNKEEKSDDIRLDSPIKSINVLQKGAGGS